MFESGQLPISGCCICGCNWLPSLASCREGRLWGQMLGRNIEELLLWKWCLDGTVIPPDSAGF